jgi:hypothetical protein
MGNGERNKAAVEERKHGKREWFKRDRDEMDILILISTFCLCAEGFQGLFKSFSLPYTIINFIFTSLKLLPNFENVY